MSDNQEWQSPGRSVPQPPVAGPTPVAWSGQIPPPPGWTPPPKPGLIPLRPLTLGAILSASFQVLRRNPRPTLGPALIISVITTGLQTVGSVTLFPNYVNSLNSGDLSAIGALYSGLLGTSAVPLLLGVLGTAILQGIISLEVARGTLGDKQKLGGLMRQLKGRLGALIGWGFLITGVLAAAIAIIVGLVVLLASLGTAGIGFAILVAVLGMFGYIAAGVFFGTKLIFVPSSVVLERLSLVDAVKRSWALTRGFFWRTFGIQALVNIMIAVGISVITTPITLLSTLGGTLFNPNATAQNLTSTLILSTVLSAIVTAIVGSIGDVVQVATTSLMYIDLRMRKEGLDLDLARYVEARAAGTAGLPDPYLPHARPAGVPAS